MAHSADGGESIVDGTVDGADGASEG